MTATAILVQRQAIAVQRALECAELLDPVNEPLRLAKEEPLRNDMYALVEVVHVLGQVCLEQRGHIVELAERIEELESRLPVEKTAAEK